MNDMSEAELDVLCRHLDFLRSLADGERTPATEAQTHFVEVAAGRACPSTEYEVAFTKWSAKNPTVQMMKKRLAVLREERLVADRVKARQERLTREVEQRYLGSSFRERPRPPIEEAIEAEKARRTRAERRRADEPPKPHKDYTPRYIEETWGARSDWKKDSGRNKWNGR